MEPKNEQRAYNLRRANRKMPRRRLDIPVEQIDYKNPPRQPRSCVLDPTRARFGAENGTRVHVVSIWYRLCLTLKDFQPF